MADNLSYSNKIIQQRIFTFTEANIAQQSVTFDFSVFTIVPDKIEVELRLNYFDTAANNPDYAFSLELDSNEFYNDNSPLAFAMWPYSGPTNFEFSNITMRKLTSNPQFNLILLSHAAVPGTGQINGYMLVRYIQYKKF